MQNTILKETQSERKYAKILGIRVDGIPESGVLRIIRQNIATGMKFSIATPNPEIVLAAQRNFELVKALNGSTISIPDGIGVVAASKFLSLPITNHQELNTFYYLLQGLRVGLAILFNRKWLESEIIPIKGRRLFSEMLRLANKKGWKVFLLGGTNGEAKKAENRLNLSLRNLKAESADGPKLNRNAEPISERDTTSYKEVLNHINVYKPDLLFVGFGAPKQEIWIAKNLSKLKVKGAMAVGGTFNYITGVISEPPKWMEKSGLEWLWRLIKEPVRFGRIWNAVVVFPWKVYKYKLAQS